MKRKTKVIMGIILLLSLIALSSITNQINADDGEEEMELKNLDPGNGGAPSGSPPPVNGDPMYQNDFQDQPILPIMIGNIPFVAN